MEQVHFAGENEDDLYGGFDDHNSALNTEELAYDPAFQQAVRTSHGRRPPPTAARLGTMAAGRKGGLVVPPSSMGIRPITGAQDGGKNRPMTAVKAAGYTSGSRGGGFDPLNQSTGGTAPALEPKSEGGIEEKIKQLERAVNLLIEESCLASAKGEHKLALDKAREAARKERDVGNLRQQAPNPENVNLDLSYSVLFNLANQLAANHMDTEALNTYKEIVRTKSFSNAGRLKVNMGNIYFRQHEYSQAIKHYRMALDQVPTTHRNMRKKINQNIGIAFVKLGQYNDAATAFRTIMSEEPNFRTGFNLILCNYALGDRDEMKQSFLRLLTVDLQIDNEDKYVSSTDDKQYSLILEIIKNDSLRKIEKQRRTEAEQCIMMAAKIIGPAIDGNFDSGYNWCIDQVKSSQYMELAHNLDIDKAIGFLKQKDFQQAVETLKSFEKKDSKVASAAATNLSFLYNLTAMEEGELNQADKYAEVALQADRFNPSALVNKGNVYFNKSEFEKARECYREALESDSSCVEALYDYGICNKRLRCYEDALKNFEKLHAILKNSAQVMFQLADLHYLLGNSAEAKEWYIQLHGLVPSDATVLKRLGDLYEEEGDYQSAYHYYYDSFKYDSTNIDVIKWLGNYNIQITEIEKALPYFQKAAMIQPTQVQWPLFVAMCLRKSGDVQRALDEYKAIHRKFPDNVECLKHLLKMLTDMNSKDVPEYANKLKKAELSQKVREERASSGRQTSGRRRADREGSAGGDGVRQSSGHARPRPANYNDGKNGPYPKPESDGIYSDPLGPQMERPRTAARRRDQQADDFENEEIGDDLLPD